MTTPSEGSIAVGGASVTALTYQPLDTPAATLVLGHGAGADQRSSFMTFCGRSLSSLGIETVTFNFLYTEQKRHVPDRRPVLEACYRAVVEAVHARLEGRRPLFIGGKSMGGRMATYIAAADAELPVRGLVLSGTRCILLAGPASGVTRICRRSAAAPCLCRGAATRLGHPRS